MVSRRSRFAAPPWPDDHPRRLELDRRLDPDPLARRLDRAAWRDGYAGVGSEAYRPERLLKAVLYERRCGRRRPAPWRRDARESEPPR